MTCHLCHCECLETFPVLFVGGKHCGEYLKCNNAEGCDNCNEYERPATPKEIMTLPIELLNEKRVCREDLGGGEKNEQRNN